MTDVLGDHHITLIGRKAARRWRLIYRSWKKGCQDSDGAHAMPVLTRQHAAALVRRS